MNAGVSHIKGAANPLWVFHFPELSKRRNSIPKPLQSLGELLLKKIGLKPRADPAMNWPRSECRVRNSRTPDLNMKKET